MQCFVPRHLIKQRKTLKYLFKSVAESSLSEARLVVKNYQKILSQMTMVLSITKVTVKDALRQHPDDRILQQLGEFANAYDTPYDTPDWCYE